MLKDEQSRSIKEFDCTSGLTAINLSKDHELKETILFLLTQSFHQERTQELRTLFESLLSQWP